jgi:hypothetical protein
VTVRGYPVYLFGLLVLVAGFAFGPAVPGLALSSSAQEYEPASGSVNVSVSELPDTLSLDRNGFGSGTYQLQSSSVVTNVSGVSGNPLVVYDIRIPGLGYNKETYRILSPDVDGTLTIRASSDTVQPGRVNASSYAATVTVLVRSDVGTRVVATSNVTVEVVE